MTKERELDILRKRAAKLAVAGDWGSVAIEVNTRMIAIDDLASDAYTRLARAFREQGKLSAARDMYAQVLTFDPRNAIARNNLADLDKFIGRADEMAQVATLSTFDEAFAVGVAARRSRRHALAVAALERALSLRPESLHAWNALGAAHRHRGNPDAARSAYEHALGLTRNPVSLVGLGAVARDVRDFARAIELYSQVLAINAYNAYGLNGLGGVYVDIGQLEDAERCFTEASKLYEGRDEAVQCLTDLRERYRERGDAEGSARIKNWLKTLVTTE